MEKNSPVIPPAFIRGRSVCVFPVGFARSKPFVKMIDVMSLCPSTTIALLCNRAACSSSVALVAGASLPGRDVDGSATPGPASAAPSRCGPHETVKDAESSQSAQRLIGEKLPERRGNIAFAADAIVLYRVGKGDW